MSADAVRHREEELVGQVSDRQMANTLAEKAVVAALEGDYEKALALATASLALRESVRDVAQSRNR